MTEFEAATLAYQNSHLWAAYAIPAVAAVVGVLQAGVVVYGIRAMIQANEGRAEADTARAEAEAARHAESMEALRALIHGMETVIARTAPKGDSQ